MKASPTHVTGWKNIQREFFRHSERNEKKIEGIAESMRRALVTHLAPDEEHSPQPTIPITEASMEDRALVEVYRSRADDSARKRLGEFADDHPAEEIGSQWNGLLSWYWRPLSVTRIPVHAAWIALVLWLFLLAFGPTWLGEYIQT